MTTLLLIDGSSYLYRAFYAIDHLATPDGTPTNALYGVINMLKKLRNTTPYDYTACVFDAPGETFRHELYPLYKGGRPVMPEALQAQIEPLYQMVAAFGIAVVMVTGVEADDVIGTLATKAVNLGIDTIISSGDKDMAQLVQARVRVENSMSKEKWDEASVMAKFGVRPDQIIDFLALKGDAIDNIPGVPGCGDKTAAKWLAQYDNLDEVIANAPTLGGRVGENLRQSIPQLPLARCLARIRCDVDLSAVLPNGLEDLRRQDEDWLTLHTLFQHYHFRQWQQEAETHLALVDRSAKTVEDPATPVRDYDTILTTDQLEAWYATLQTAKLVSFDTETTSLDPFKARLVGLSFAIRPGRAAYLPLTHCGAAAPQLPLEHCLALLRPWFESEAYQKLGQNSKYDQHVLANYGIELRGIVDDTLLMSYVLASHQRHNLDALAQRVLGETTIQYETLCGKGKAQIRFDQVPIPAAAVYAAEDADIAWRVAEVFHQKLSAQPTLKALYETIELPLRSVLFRMERNGIAIDSQKLTEQSHEISQQLAALEQQAYTFAGVTFNLASSKQLAAVLFERLGLPVVKKTPKGLPSTDEAVLTRLAANYPIAAVLLTHRTLSKLKLSYTDTLPTMVNAKTQRIHCDFKQAVTVTGRLACSDPNLQNIPIRTDEGRRIRAAFIAAPGCWLLSADYSQIELRIMAHLSGDDGLCRAFVSGHDIHAATAAEIFGVAIMAVTRAQRRAAKAINFGLIYGMSAFGLAGQLNSSRKDAQAFIDRYFTQFPGVARYMKTTRNTAREQGWIETLFGRRLYLPNINSNNALLRSAAERAAINAPMQGTAADLIKKAMIAVQRWLDDTGLKTRLLLQIHDELVLEVPESEVALVQSGLRDKMEGITALQVPLQVKLAIGRNWDEAH